MAAGLLAAGLAATVPDQPMMRDYHLDRIAEARAPAAGRVRAELLETGEPSGPAGAADREGGA
jgi:hypothetical protein